jgi:PilZ domain
VAKSIRAAILADNAADASHSDQRGEERLSLAVNQAVVVWRGRELEVSVCDVSAGGVMIETLDLRPKIGETVQLRIAECLPVKCTICWFKGCRIGLQFAHETSIDGPCEVQEFIVRKLRGETSAASDRAQVPRPRRYRLIWHATLHHEHESTPARIRNISPEGAMIECDWDLHAGTEVMLDLHEAGTLVARVRWCQRGQVGLQFASRFDLRTLAACKPVPARSVRAHPLPGQAVKPRRVGMRRGVRLSVRQLADLFRDSRQR